MAADQRKKKRVNAAASLVGCTSREKYPINKKKIHVQQHDLNMRPNISLEWDSRKKSVVPKKEQIGLSKRHLIPFIEPGSRGHSILADVLPVPLDIFELENLYEVISYEVWQRHLSDNERRFLSEFLPKEVEPDKTVQDLLSGDSFHFGNPFVKWSTSVCLGDLHPDDVVHEERSLKATKQAYYSFLEKYHNDMIDKLEMWKGKWSSCKDLDVDIMENIWSCRKHGEKTRFCGSEENHVATPDSCSWPNSEIAYSSENQNLGTLQRRDISEKKSDSSSSGQKLVATAPRKGERLHKRNIQQNDGAKYMSYIKVSREQHERVKSSIKHAGNSIQSRSLNNVLGSFDALNVQPFARFEEEESKKLHDYWMRLATKDIPVGFANWRKRQLQRQEQTRSIGEEIGQKVELQETLDEGKYVSSSNLMEMSDGEGEVPLSDTVEEVVKEQSDDDLLQEQNCNEGSLATEVEEIRNGYIFEKHDTEMNEDDDAANHVMIEDHSISSLNSSPRSTMVTSSSPGFLPEQQISSLGHIKDENPQTVSGYLGNMNIPLSQASSSSDVWPVGGSYYQSVAPYPELLIGHPPFMQEQMLNHRRQSDVIPLLSSYSNQDRSELLHSLLKGQNSFQSGNDIVMDTAHFSGPGDMRQKRGNDLYLHQESIYSGGRFAVPRQEDFPVHLNSNWYTADAGTTRDGWPPSLEAIGGGNSDQTLFSVLSECNELPRHDAARFIGNYNGNGNGIPSTSTTNFLPQSSSNYSSGHEVLVSSAGVKINNLGWMGMGLPLPLPLPQQNSESIAKPFLRSWNQ